MNRGKAHLIRVTHIALMGKGALQGMDILMQRAAQGDVKLLNSPTNGQHGYARRHRRPHQRQGGVIARAIQWVRCRLNNGG